MASITPAELNAFKALLGRLQGHFQELLALFDDERARVKARDLPGLELTARRIELLLATIHDLDGERQAVTTRFATALGLDPEGVSLADLDTALGGASGLLPIRAALREAAGLADQRNRENRAIMRGVMEATEAILDIFRTSAQGSSGYDRRGGRGGGRGDGYHFLSKKL